MSWEYFISRGIDLWVRDRIDEASAKRQRRTAEEIVRRLASQPGIILADEVGMGKTYVALAVGVSIALTNQALGAEGGPVVVMVPSSVKDKWPREFGVFRERCLKAAATERIRLVSNTADTGVEFLKLLDDPPERKTGLVFVSHGALARGLDDPWVKLALVKRTLRRHGLAAVREGFPKFGAQLLRGTQATSELLADLLAAPTHRWRGIMTRHGRDPGDDPVPEPLWAAIDELGQPALEAVASALEAVPLRQSVHLAERLTDARRAITAACRSTWSSCLKSACRRIRLPLLILDEAHHLKNPATRTASLFADAEAEQDGTDLNGALAGVFERMLFLTATPFQLGHRELLNVLSRFGGIAWDSEHAPDGGRQRFDRDLAELGEALDRFQLTGLGLDRVWQRIRPEHVRALGADPGDAESFWGRVSAEPPEEGPVADARRQVAAMRQARERAEGVLRPWVLRHRRSRWLRDDGTPRRVVMPGSGIIDGSTEAAGIDVAGPALLPFLLAARAQALGQDAARTRALFAEGLASSYEAYRETRHLAALREDEPEEDQAARCCSPELEWYLGRIEEALPAGDIPSSSEHPKMRRTIDRVVDLWSRGEKVLVFCHYRATGRALQRNLSAAVERALELLAAERFGVSLAAGQDRLARLNDRLMRSDDPLRIEVDGLLGQLVVGESALSDVERERLVEVMRRFIRTEAFLARFFPRDDGEGAVARAFEARDASNLRLEDRLRAFVRFVAQRADSEREDYLAALEELQIGERVERGEGAERLSPNVRLVNGETEAATRRRVLLSFNTPFFPEILVASSVFAEGVDLHLACRYVIHHDLCWNPSTLEQRTGRVDRIGAKAEQAGAPVHVYLPYVAETQDEKMFRVVMDRERWFQVVMGDSYQVDDVSTDAAADRIPLPASLAESLGLRLEVEQ
jgi:superfamily II DNA or RNA helicase